MFLANILSDGLGHGAAGLIALLGYAIVFFGLVLLQIVVILLGKAFTAKKKKPAQNTAEVPVISKAPVAPGSAGQLNIHDVPPKTAAMIMAIVANELGKPLNELRFISIKEVK